MTQDRVLPPLKAFRHALRSVRDYAGLGIRISLIWTVLLLALALTERMVEPPDAQALPEDLSVLQLFSAAIGLVAFSSIAVNWHRFVLRDEPPSPSHGLRLDRPVWRYTGNSLVIVAAMVLPSLLVILAAVFLPPAASILALPTAVVAGTFALSLSLKLPAVALGRTDFSFGHALSAANGQFWPLLAVFALNLLVAFAGILAMITVTSVTTTLGPLLSMVVEMGLAAAFNIFFTLFSISLATSIYGYLVEKRDF
jgi:hypothetical protein